MKTRKKTVKTPTKGRRRSSVIMVKKSPIRRNQRRNLKIPNKYSILSDYESPLRSLKDNGELKPSTSTSLPVKEECMKEEHVEEIFQDQKPIHLSVTTKCNPTDSEVVKQEKIVKDNSSSEQNNSTQDSMAENADKAVSKSQKRNASTFVASRDKPNLKKRKLKKSPLSRMNESKELNTLSESVIIIDDSLSEQTALNKVEKKNEIIKDILTSSVERSSDFKSSSTTFTEKIKDTKSVVDTIKTYQNNTSEQAVNSISNHFESLQFMSRRNVDNSKTVTSNEDVVEIDCNDTMMEMEAYHNAFNQTADSPPTCPNFADSVIVIDPDDDEDNVNNTDQSPALKIDGVAKPLEDCFVVWSSLPSTSTSTSSTTTTETPTFSTNPLYNNNLDILKFNKILIDTNADISNLRFLNNENNKMRKNQLKSPRNVKGVKKPLLKTTMDKGKTSVKNSAKGASKFVDKTTNGFLARAAAKASTKVVTKTTAKVASRTPTKTAVKSKIKPTGTPTTVKKNSKSNGQLIFSSTSKEDGENKTAKKKNMKGKLREIVIDGCNVAMAYNHNNIFSEKGIKMCIEYFTKREHVVKVFIPQSRRSLKFPLLEKWFKEGIVVFTPSRKIGNKFITSYDDRYILEYAAACGGIVVSQDQFRDLYVEKQAYRDIIENRLLVPTFVGDYVMFPEDPLGRDGPSLIDFLKH
ncbi:NEDD4-binding protein 1 [Nasonia vitripennis]|uniref:RNase NYN domain-containing protein n=1 Tax=Nasonia vitripennis TaxID=7425 RepID=A0A7M7G3P8_NASVI|nr:NEDD4-binding protein 1 [Nasonia vitripennis]XP_003426793.1 NEDD4-binding protein 1 [Nasonia vitripennis]